MAREKAIYKLLNDSFSLNILINTYFTTGLKLEQVYKYEFKKVDEVLKDIKTEDDFKKYDTLDNLVFSENNTKSIIKTFSMLQRSLKILSKSIYCTIDENRRQNKDVNYLLENNRTILAMIEINRSLLQFHNDNGIINIHTLFLFIKKYKDLLIEHKVCTNSNLY